MSAQKPSIGRIVHHVGRGSADGEYDKECRAAVVTLVDLRPATPEQETSVSLCVLTQTGHFNNDQVQIDEGRVASEETMLCTGLDHEGGTWHWPARD